MYALIKNGTIIDGTSNDRFVGDVRIQDHKIVEIGENLKHNNKEEVIDAQGLFITPGFIDISCQSDMFGSLFSAPRQESLLRQGITSIFIGNKGFSYAPLLNPYIIFFSDKKDALKPDPFQWHSFEEYLQHLQANNFGVNVGSLVGYSSLYQGIVGKEQKHISAQQADDMLYLAKKSIEQGAFGVSIDFSQVYASDHLQGVIDLTNTTNSLLSIALHSNKDLADVCSLLESSNGSAHFSHPCYIGTEQQGYEDMLTMFKESHKENQNKSFDIHPYLESCVPLRVFESCSDQDMDTLLEHSVVAGGGAPISWIHKTIGDIAKRQEKSVHAVAKELLTIQNNILLFVKTRTQEHIKHAIKHAPFVSTDSAGYDLGASMPKNITPHPSAFGAVQKVFLDFVFYQKIVSLEQVVASLSSAPAYAIKFRDRGEIKKGYYADVVIWDFQNISAPATIQDPYQYSTGVEYVIVNGTVAYKAGENITTQPGRILKNR